MVGVPMGGGSSSAGAAVMSTATAAEPPSPVSGGGGFSDMPSFRVGISDSRIYEPAMMCPSWHMMLGGGGCGLVARHGDVDEKWKKSRKGNRQKMRFASASARFFL